MNTIKASELQAATMLEGALIINDGRYIQWQDLFFKKLKEVTGMNWQENGWDELPAKKGEVVVHRLSFFHGKSTVALDFVEIPNGQGYQFASGFVVTPDSRAAKSIFKRDVANGRDLLDIISKHFPKAAATASDMAQATQDLKSDKAKKVAAALRKALRTVPPTKSFNETRDELKAGSYVRLLMVVEYGNRRTELPEGSQKQIEDALSEAGLHTEGSSYAVKLSNQTFITVRFENSPYGFYALVSAEVRTQPYNPKGSKDDFANFNSAASYFMVGGR